MKIAQLRILYVFVLFLISNRHFVCPGKHKHHDITFEGINRVSSCLTLEKRNNYAKEFFEGCKDAVARAFHRKHKHPDQGKTVPEMVKRQGYPLESYEVFTEDGYILTLFRLLGKPGHTKKHGHGKPAVLLMHGMLQSSEGWFIQEGDRALPFKLVNHGFDVFLGNARGTRYSLKHRTLDPDSNADYWQFSWHEMGLYDIPANIQKILEITHNKKVYYVGFSMGTTQFFVGLSERQELNFKIEAAVLISPVAYMGHSDSPARITAPILSEPGVKGVIEQRNSGRTESFQNGFVFKNASSKGVCTETAYLCGLCGFFPYFVAGFNPEQTNYTNLSNEFSKLDEAVSVATLVHYTQNINSCKFRKFDFGRRHNLKVYGQPKPPEYHIGRISVPTYFFQGATDKFAYAEDVNTTRRHMRPGVVKKQIMVPRQAWAHFDFAAGKEADTLVFDKVVKILEMHVKNNVHIDDIDDSWKEATLNFF